MVLEKTLESPLDCKEIKLVNPKGNQSWIFIGRTDADSNTLATWCEELTHWKIPWYWERIMAGGEGDDRGGDGWMALPTRWTWDWASPVSWWWTGKPGVLQSMGSQRVGHNWATKVNRDQGNTKSEWSIQQLPTGVAITGSWLEDGKGAMWEPQVCRSGCTEESRKMEAIHVAMATNQAGKGLPQAELAGRQLARKPKWRSVLNSAS